MVFYVSLTIACFVTALVFVWLVRSLVNVGKAAFRAVLPSSRDNIDTSRPVRLSSDLHRSRSPWGWSGGAASGKQRSAVAKAQHTPVSSMTREQQNADKVPWGWAGNNHLRQSNLKLISSGIEHSAAMASVRSVLSGYDISLGKPAAPATSSPAALWPYREEEFNFAGKRYRLRGEAKTELAGPALAAKPWGW